METTFRNKIEKLICPFDFTTTSRAGLEYAGMLAKALDASLTIFDVQPPTWPEAIQLYEDGNDSARALRRLLKAEAQAIEEAHGIRCNYSIEPTTDTVQVAIGSVSSDYDLIVMGTNGADNLYQHVFGSDSHHFLGLAKCPVLMIPNGYGARIPKLMVYAFDPETNPVFPASHNKSLGLPLGVELRILHVVPNKNSVEAKKKMELLGNILGVKEEEGFDWGFEPLYSDDAVSAVDAHMKQQNADILALSYHHRALFEKLFQENVIKEVSRIADYPVLVLWH